MAQSNRRTMMHNTSFLRRARFGLFAALAALPLGAAVAEADTGDAVAGSPQFEAVEVVQPIAAAQTEVLPETVKSVAPVSRVIGSGVASFYGAELHGRRTASGERFDMHAHTAAHRTLPFGTRVLVTNPATGRSVTVRINDRGPFHGGRLIDLSRAAANEIGLVARGHGRVELSVVEG